MISSLLKTTNLERKKVPPVNSQKSLENVPATQRTENTWRRNQKSRKLKQTDRLDKASKAKLRVSHLNQPAQRKYPLRLLLRSTKLDQVRLVSRRSLRFPKQRQSCQLMTM